MDQEQFRNENHEILSHFVETTKIDDEITSSVKCTIAQFLLKTREDLQSLAKQNSGKVSVEQVINIQIEELRRCIIDLTTSLQFYSNHKEVLQ